jgi:hypothetical protein
MMPIMAGVSRYGKQQVRSPETCGFAGLNR